MITQILFLIAGIITVILFIVIGLSMIAFAICEHGGLVPLIFGVAIILIIIAITLHLLGL